MDSSVAAAILKEQGYEVVGLFMRNWREEEGGACTAEADYADVRRVCNALDIPYYSIDFSKEYYERVFKLFVDEYKAGRTPNPDVLCNREIKFGPFKDFAEKLGGDLVATGHYCGILHRDGKTYLRRALDDNKDQTYFLSAVSEKQLKNVVFPLENIEKPEVRRIAEKYNLATKAKKDSTGVCFIGERDFRKFLKEYIPMKRGDILDMSGNKVGEHDGVFYYTIGQRKGFGIGGGGNGEPWYIIKRDVKNNILYVNQGECDELFSDRLIAENFNFITDKVKDGGRYRARIRHRQPLQPCTVHYIDDTTLEVVFDTRQRAVAPGQYCVLYDDPDLTDDGICYGGGIII